jgi:hypothetical protein
MVRIQSNPELLLYKSVKPSIPLLYIRRWHNIFGSFRKEMMQEKQPYTQLPAEHPGGENVARNPNPRANENIRVRSEEPKENIEKEVGSEITDGEDA